jgi:hypothetical protein
METPMAYSVHSSTVPPGIVNDRRKERGVIVDRWVAESCCTAGEIKKDICVGTTTNMQLQEPLTISSVHPSDTLYQILRPSMTSVAADTIPASRVLEKGVDAVSFARRLFEHP